MSYTIILFTMKGCPYCLELKKALDDLKIPYYEIPIHEHKSIWEQVVKQVGFRNLPTVFIKEGESDFGPVFVPGRDFNNKEEIVEIIKKYTNKF